MSAGLEKFERLRELLWTRRLFFCVVYDIENTVDLRFNQLISPYWEKPEHQQRLAAELLPTALRCLEKNGSGVIRPIDSDPEDRKWWGVSIAGGPTRRAGHVIVIGMRASSRTDIEGILSQVQQIMR